MIRRIQIPVISLLMCAAALVVTLTVSCSDAPGDDDTFEIPKDTPVIRALALGVPAEVAERGENLFVRKQCHKCHKISGTKKTIGPILTDIKDRMDVPHLEAWIRHPRSLKKGTLMPEWDGTDDELIALIAYLRTLSSSAKKKPLDIKVTKPTAVEILKDTPVVRALEAGVPERIAKEGAAYFTLKGCNKCHKTKGKIATVGPVLAGIKDRMDIPTLETWIRHPSRLKAGTLMPIWDGNDKQLISLIAYLRTL